MNGSSDIDTVFLTQNAFRKETKCKNTVLVDVPNLRNVFDFEVPKQLLEFGNKSVSTSYSCVQDVYNWCWIQRNLHTPLSECDIFYKPNKAVCRGVDKHIFYRENCVREYKHIHEEQLQIVIDIIH
jgi:hypothetical protein